MTGMTGTGIGQTAGAVVLTQDEVNAISSHFSSFLITIQPAVPLTIGQLSVLDGMSTYTSRVSTPSAITLHHLNKIQGKIDTAMGKPPTVVPMLQVKPNLSPTQMQQKAIGSPQAQKPKSSTYIKVPGTPGPTGTSGTISTTGTGASGNTGAHN